MPYLNIIKNKYEGLEVTTGRTNGDVKQFIQQGISKSFKAFKSFTESNAPNYKKQHIPKTI